MKFGEAVEALRAGKVVYRKGWDGTKLFYIPATENQLEMIGVHLWNGKDIFGWLCTAEDIFATDWVVE